MRKNKIFLFVLATAVLSLFISACSGPPDFTKLSDEEAAKAIKGMDSKILSVTIHEQEGLGQIPIVEFRARESLNILVTEGDNLKNIAEKITKAEGNERFFGIIFHLYVPVVDNYNNKSDALGLDMAWFMDTLKKINWSDFQGFQFLGAVDIVKRGPQGDFGILKRYCNKDSWSYNENFCRMVD